MTLALPVILERLSPESRSWLIAKAAADGRNPEEITREVIEKAAAKDGFKAPPATKLPAAA